MKETPSSTRRAALRLSGAVILGGLAGCSALSSDSPDLNLAVFNQTDNPYTIELDILESDNDQSRSDARVYSEAIDVEPQEEARREPVADARPYVIRYSAFEDNSRQTDQDHIHYYPDDDGDEDDVSFDIYSPGVLQIRDY